MLGEDWKAGDIAVAQLVQKLTAFTASCATVNATEQKLSADKIDRDLKSDDLYNALVTMRQFVIAAKGKGSPEATRMPKLRRRSKTAAEAAPEAPKPKG